MKVAFVDILSVVVCERKKEIPILIINIYGISAVMDLDINF